MAVEVRCTQEADGYRCGVMVSDAAGTTSHAVRVSKAEMARWARGRPPEQLVKDSFDFLLRRESKESIFPEFDLSVIKRFFPDYDGGP